MPEITGKSETRAAAAPASNAASPVLVAIDLQAQSEELLRRAGEHAAAEGTELLIVHIVHEPAGKPGFYRQLEGGDGSVEPLEVVARRVLSTLLEHICQSAPDDSPLHNARLELVGGLPRNRIAELAHKHEARVILLGHSDQKKNRFEQLLDKSVSKHVAKHSDIPVVVI